MTPEQEKGIMQAFDTDCKTVLRNKARNLHKALERKGQYEIPLDELPSEVEESLQYQDKYDFSQSVPVNSSEERMTVSDPVLASAFVQFLPRFREVIYPRLLLCLFGQELKRKTGMSTPMCAHPRQ